MPQADQSRRIQDRPFLQADTTGVRRVSWTHESHTEIERVWLEKLERPDSASSAVLGAKPEDCTTFHSLFRIFSVIS